jgi:hypothetical protein
MRRNPIEEAPVHNPSLFKLTLGALGLAGPSLGREPQTLPPEPQTPPPEPSLPTPGR